MYVMRTQYLANKDGYIVQFLSSPPVVVLLGVVGLLMGPDWDNFRLQTTRTRTDAHLDERGAVFPSLRIVEPSADRRIRSGCRHHGDVVVGWRDGISKERGRVNDMAGDDRGRDGGMVLL